MDVFTLDGERGVDEAHTTGLVAARTLSFPAGVCAVVSVTPWSCLSRFLCNGYHYFVVVVGGGGRAIVLCCGVGGRIVLYCVVL